MTRFEAAAPIVGDGGGRSRVGVVVESEAMLTRGRVTSSATVDAFVGERVTLACDDTDVSKIMLYGAATAR